MQLQSGMQLSAPHQAAAAQACPRRSTRACVLQRAQTRRTAAAARSRGSQTVTTGSDTWDSNEGSSGSEDSDSEASSVERGPRTSSGRRQQHHTGRGVLLVGATGGLPAAAATAAAAATSQGLASSGALASSLDQQGFTLHQPYSHFLWCGYQLNRKCKFHIACALCTDIEELQNVNGICSAQVSVVKHPADFDVKGYVLQHPTMQQEQPVTQGAMLQAGSSNGSSSTVLGPLAATLKRSEDGRVCMSGLSWQIIVSLAGGTVPHTLELQERVSSSSGPTFLLHIIPSHGGLNPSDAHTQKSKYTSRAGEGPGLQVFPGSVPQVAEAGRLILNRAGTITIIIPKVIVCSQLLAGTTFPLKMTVALKHNPASGQQGQGSQPVGPWQVTATHSNNCTYIRVCKSHALVACANRSISAASLSQDSVHGVRLTLTLAAATAGPEPAVAAAVPAAAATDTSAALTAAAPLGLVEPAVPALPAAPAAADGPMPTLPTPAPAPDDNAGPPAAARVTSHPVSVSAVATALAAAELPEAAHPTHHSMLGMVPSRHLSSAPLQHKTALPAKRPAEQLHGSNREGVGASNAATASLLISAAPQLPGASRKKPRLPRLQPDAATVAAAAAATAGAVAAAADAAPATGRAGGSNNFHHAASFAPTGHLGAAVGANMAAICV